MDKISDCCFVVDDSRVVDDAMLSNSCATSDNRSAKDLASFSETVLDWLVEPCAKRNECVPLPVPARVCFRFFLSCTIVSNGYQLRVWVCALCDELMVMPAVAYQITLLIMRAISSHALPWGWW